MVDQWSAPHIKKVANALRTFRPFITQEMIEHHMLCTVHCSKQFSHAELHVPQACNTKVFDCRTPWWHVHVKISQKTRLLEIGFLSQWNFAGMRVTTSKTNDYDKLLSVAHSNNHSPWPWHRTSRTPNKKSLEIFSPKINFVEKSYMRIFIGGSACSLSLHRMSEQRGICTNPQIWLGIGTK